MMKQADGRQVRDWQIRQFLSNQLKRWGGLSGRSSNKPWTAEQLRHNFSSKNIVRSLQEQGIRVSTKEVNAVKRTMPEFDNIYKSMPEASGKNKIEPVIEKKPTEALVKEKELAKLLERSGKPSHARGARRSFTLNPLQYLLNAASSSGLQTMPNSINNTINLQNEINKLGNPEKLGPRARARYYRLTDRLAAASKGPSVPEILNRVNPLSTTPGRVTAAMNSSVGRPVVKGLGAAAIMNAPWAVYDNRKDFNLENLGYLGHSKPWLEFARDASGLHHASTDMFDEVGSGAFWKALPGEIGRSALDTGKALFVDPVTRTVDALAPAAEAVRKDQFDAVNSGGPGTMASRWR